MKNRKNRRIRGKTANISKTAPGIFFKTPDSDSVSKNDSELICGFAGFGHDPYRRTPFYAIFFYAIFTLTRFANLDLPRFTRFFLRDFSLKNVWKTFTFTTGRHPVLLLLRSIGSPECCFHLYINYTTNKASSAGFNIGTRLMDVNFNLRCYCYHSESLHSPPGSSHCDEFGTTCLHNVRVTL